MYSTVRVLESCVLCARQVIGEDRFYRTGDLGTMDADGNLRVVGRLKDLIVRGGSKVFPAEVEQVFHCNALNTGSNLHSFPKNILYIHTYSYFIINTCILISYIYKLMTVSALFELRTLLKVFVNYNTVHDYCNLLYTIHVQ